MFGVGSISGAGATGVTASIMLSHPFLCNLAGEVTEKHTEKATIESKGKPITKDGDSENPNFKVERKGKNPVIKRVCLGHDTPIANLQYVAWTEY